MRSLLIYNVCLWLLADVGINSILAYREQNTRLMQQQKSQRRDEETTALQPVATASDWVHVEQPLRQVFGAYCCIVVDSFSSLVNMMLDFFLYYFLHTWCLHVCACECVYVCVRTFVCVCVCVRTCIWCTTYCSGKSIIILLHSKSHS